MIWRQTCKILNIRTMAIIEREKVANRRHHLQLLPQDWRFLTRMRQGGRWLDLCPMERTYPSTFEADGWIGVPWNINCPMEHTFPSTFEADGWNNCPMEHNCLMEHTFPSTFELNRMRQWGRWLGLWIHLFIHFVSHSQAGIRQWGRWLQFGTINSASKLCCCCTLLWPNWTYTEADGTEGWQLLGKNFTIHARALLYLCSRWRWHFNLQMDCNPRHLLIS